MRNNRRSPPNVDKGEMTGTLKLNAISPAERRTMNIESAKEVQAPIIARVINTS